MSPIVETDTGRVRGVVEGGVARYSGIPFARVLRRFARPAPMSWDSVFDASGWGPAPWQPLPSYDELGAERSEDCLNLNVWARSDSTHVPVVVWVYGGGWEQGSNASPATRGDILARSGRVVVVSLNYRVTSLGWARFTDVNQEAEVANLGLHDLVAGLEWVQRNIAAFGGDPDRITVVGESAGGFNLSALLGSARGRKTFHRLAAFSGGPSRIIPIDVANSVGAEILRELDADPRSCQPEALVAAQRRVIPTDIGLRNAATPRSLGVVADTSLDDGVLDTHPQTAISSGDVKDIDLWFGSTRDEAALFREHAPSEYVNVHGDALADQVEQWTGGNPRSREVSAIYERASEDGSPRERLITDWVYRLPNARAALSQAAAGGNAYLSVHGRADGQPAGHAADVAELFGRTAPGAGGESHRRQRDLTAALLRFAESGNPGWERVTNEPTTRTIGPDTFDATRAASIVLAAWDGIPRP